MKPYPVFLAIEIAFLYQQKQDQATMQIDQEIDCRTGNNPYYRQHYRNLIQKWVKNISDELQFPHQDCRSVLKDLLEVNKNSRIYRQFNQTLQTILKDQDLEIEDMSKKVAEDTDLLPTYSDLLEMREENASLLTNIPNELDGDIFNDLYSLAENGDLSFEQYRTRLLGGGQNSYKPE
jgi:hypothetical protein